MYAQVMASTRRKTDEPPVHIDQESGKPTKLYRGYSVMVRGELPKDIEEIVSKLHSEAIRRPGRDQDSTSDATNSI